MTSGLQLETRSFLHYASHHHWRSRYRMQTIACVAVPLKRGGCTTPRGEDPDTRVPFCVASLHGHFGEFVDSNQWGFCSCRVEATSSNFQSNMTTQMMGTDEAVPSLTSIQIWEHVSGHETKKQKHTKTNTSFPSLTYFSCFNNPKPRQTSTNQRFCSQPNFWGYEGLLGVLGGSGLNPLAQQESTPKAQPTTQVRL